MSSAVDKSTDRQHNARYQRQYDSPEYGKATVMRHKTIHSRFSRLRIAAGQTVLILTLVVMLFLSLLPVLNMVRQSLGGEGTLAERFLANYTAAWRAMRPYIANSMVTSLAAMAGVVFLSSLAGYVFARHRFPASRCSTCWSCRC